MSDTLEARKQAILAKEEEYFNKLEIEKQEASGTVESSFVPTPELEEAKIAFETTEESTTEEIGKRLNWMMDHKEALAYKTGTEVVGGMGLQYLLAKNAPKIKTALQATRAYSMLGFAGPQAAEPTTTTAGVVGFVASEAALRMLPWAVSNYAGQQVGMELGIQDEYSYWETAGAAIFSLAKVEQLADKTLRLGVSGAWAGKNMAVNGVKTFVSGAILGSTEQLFVQEMEARFNGKERDKYAYLFGAAFGGAFKTGIEGLGGLARSKWGRQELLDINEGVKERVKETKVELQNQIEDLRKPVEKGVSSGINWEASTAPLQKKIDELEKKIRDKDLQLQMLEDSTEQLKASNKAEDIIEEEGSEITPIEEHIEAAQKTTKEALEEFRAEEPSKFTEEDLEVPKERQQVEEVVEEPSNFVDESFDPDNFKPKTEEPKVSKEGWQTTKEVKGESKVEVQTSSWKGVDEYGDPVEVVVKWYNGEYQGAKTYELKPDGSRGGSTNSIVYKKTEDKLKQGDTSALPEVIEQQPGAFKKEEVEIKAPEVVEEPTRPRLVDDVRESALDEATKRFKTLKLDDPKANTEGPKLAQLITKVRDETELQLHKHKVAIATDYNTSGKEIDIKHLEGALKEVRFLQNVYNIKHKVDTFAGRFLQSMAKDAESKFEYTNELSEAATEQTHALIRLENALIEQINGVQHNELIATLHDNYFDIRPAQKEKSRQIRKKLREQYEGLPKEEQQQLIEPKPIDEAKAQADRIAKLEKQLKEKEEIFSSQREEPKTKEPRVLSLQEEDLQAKLKFHRTASKESKEIAGLEEKLDRFFKLLDEGDVKKIRQEVGPAPEWVKPEKVTSYLDTLRGVVKKTEKDLKQKVVESDLSLQDPDQIVGTVQKELAKLNLKLNELRKRFGDLDAIQKIPKEQTELDPEIVEVKREIEFYKRAEQDALRLQAKYKQRDELAEKQTAPLGEQREFITPKPEGPTRAKSIEEEGLDSDINFLRKNIKDRINEIDQAAKDIDPVEQARRLKRQYEAEEVKLNKQLDEYRAKFLAVNEIEFKATGKKKKIENDSRFKEKEREIKYYKTVLNEIPKLLKIEQEIARLADIKGRAIVGEIRAEVEPKLKGPKVETALSKLQKKKTAIKADMRKTITELEKANEFLIRQDKNIELVEYLAEWDKMTSEQSSLNKLSRGVNTALRMRKSGFLMQAGSAIAGVPSATFEWLKLVTARPLTVLLYDSIRYKSFSEGLQLARYEYQAGAKLWSDIMQYRRAAKQTYKTGRSATDHQAGKMFSSNYNVNSKNVMQSASIKAKKQKISQKTMEEMLEQIYKGDLVSLVHLYDNFLSIGGRAIGTFDEVTRRPAVFHGLYSESLKDSFHTHKGIKDKVKREKAIEEYAEKLFNERLTQEDGLAVLNENGKINERVRRVNEAFFFGSNTDDIPELHNNIADKTIKLIEKVTRNKNNPAVMLFKERNPFINMALRGTYRGAKLVAFPVAMTRVGYFNPYQGKIRAYNKNINKNKAMLLDKPELLSDEMKANAYKEIEDNQRKIQDAEVRKHIYNQETIADSFMGAAVYGAAFTAAWNGMMTGSQVWMTREQKENMKMYGGTNNYDFFGFDYRYWDPVKHVMAMTADIAVWSKMKLLQGITGERLLTKEQDFITIVTRSFAQIQKDAPLNLGGSEIADWLLMEGEEKEIALNRLLSSWFPVPAFLKKAMRRLTTGGKVADLRGGDWAERTLYQMFGIGPENYKTDLFGHEIIDTSNWGTDQIRLWQRSKGSAAEMNERLSEVLQSDQIGVIENNIPTTIVGGSITMTDFTDADGVHLEYAYAKKLQKFKKDGKTLRDLFVKKVNSKDFKTKLKKEIEDENREDKLPVNQGHKELADDARSYYKELEKEILENKRFLQKFRNEEGENLYNVIKKKQKQGKILREKTKEPISIKAAGQVEVDVFELLESNPQLQRTD